MRHHEIVLTPEGLKKVQAELDELKSVSRSHVAERIREAKTYGEIGENSEYEDAKAEQAQVEGRIETLTYLLHNAIIVDKPEKDGKVGIGSTVRLRDVTTGEEVYYQMVGAEEADPAEHRISNQSPLGDALMGRSTGKTVKVKTPSGTRTYVILSVGQ